MGTLGSNIEVMPVDVYEGGNGDLVLTQEWPDMDGESYTRIMIPMEEAFALAQRILATAKRAKA